MIDRRHGPALLAIADDPADLAGDMTHRAAPGLDDGDRARLVRAIEGALEVDGIDGFQHWLRGPFAALLPNEAAVCLELGADDRVRRLACAHHRLIEAGTLDALLNAEHRLAALLARTCRRPGQPFALDAAALGALPVPDATPSREVARNAIAYRFRLLAGNDYAFVLLDVPDDRLDRSLRLFKLLSSHLKMALARAMPPRRDGTEVVLTPRELEILRLMAAGRSNREIAASLAINPITLKNHIAKIYRKLDVQGRAEAISRGRSYIDIDIDIDIGIDIGRGA